MIYLADYRSIVKTIFMANFLSLENKKSSTGTSLFVDFHDNTKTLSIQL